MAITACAKRRDLKRGTQIYAQIPNSERNAFVQNAMISLRGECADCDGARAVFEAMGAHKD